MTFFTALMVYGILYCIFFQAMKKKYLKITASAQGAKALIRITDRISEYTEASSKEVKRIVGDFISQGVTQAEVYINSGGGEVFEATEIANELKRFDSVHITVGAVAASAATYIVAKYTTSAHSNSQLMIHKPTLFVQGNVQQIESQLQLLKNITDDYLKAYAAKTGKTEAEIEDLWKDGDCWLTAEKAKEAGLIDEVIEDEEPVTAESLAVLEACAAPVLPDKSKIKSLKSKKIMDRDEIISALGLAQDADDEQIKKALVTQKAKAERADAFESQAEANRKTAAKALVDKAVSEKRITAEKAEIYRKLAEADYESTKNVLESLPTIEALSRQLNPKSDMSDKLNVRAEWTLEDWLDKDPKGLAEMEKGNPEAFVKLNEEYYK